MTLVCPLTWPFSIPAIISAAQVKKKWALGDVAGAQAASSKARESTTWAVVVGIAFLVGATIYEFTIGGLSGGSLSRH